MATALIRLHPSLAQQLEEGVDRLAGTATAEPKHLFAGRINDHRGVAMPLMDGELVHGQKLHSIEVDRAKLALEIALFDGLDRLAVDAVFGGDMLVRGYFAKPRHRLFEAAGQAGMGFEPAEGFKLWSARQAEHTAAGDHQPCGFSKDRKITDPPHG